VSAPNKTMKVLGDPFLQRAQGRRDDHRHVRTECDLAAGDDDREAFGRQQQRPNHASRTKALATIAVARKRPVTTIAASSTSLRVNEAFPGLMRQPHSLRRI
jgi:hypothetical protein